MRLFVSIIATAMFFVASAASAAITFTADARAAGGNLLAMSPGELLTIDITVRSDGEGLFGLGASASDFVPGSINLVSSIVSGAIMSQAVTGPGTGFGGINNELAAAAELNPIQVQFMNGVSTAATPATGENDVSPVTDAAGGPQFQLVFAVQESTTIMIGSNFNLGEVANGADGFLAVTNDLVTVVVPEPGTALLMGLGLAGLAAAGRRE